MTLIFDIFFNRSHCSYWGLDLYDMRKLCSVFSFGMVIWYEINDPTLQSQQVIYEYSTVYCSWSCVWFVKMCDWVVRVFRADSCEFRVRVSKTLCLFHHKSKTLLLCVYHPCSFPIYQPAAVKRKKTEYYFFKRKCEFVKYTSHLCDVHKAWWSGQKIIWWSFEGDS